MQALIPIVIAIALVGLVVQTLLHLLPVILAGCLIALAAKILPPIIRHIRKERYFASAEFLAHKNKIASVVAEHNEVARYVSEIRDRGSFRLGASSTGMQAYLASFQNISYHSYRRDRNEANSRHRTYTTARCKSSVTPAPTP